MDESKSYRYPTREEIAADVQMESAAITVTMARIADVLEDCPLEDHMKAYPLIELAFKYGSKEYIENVFSEVSLFIKPSNR